MVDEYHSQSAFFWIYIERCSIFRSLSNVIFVYFNIIVFINFRSARHRIIRENYTELIDTVIWGLTFDSATDLISISRSRVFSEYQSTCLHERWRDLLATLLDVRRYHLLVYYVINDIADLSFILFYYSRLQTWCINDQVTF